jgi:putative Holliday junction resolvase
MAGRFLAIDFGERRIGLAMGSAETGMAFPRPYIDTQRTAPLPHLTALVLEERPDAIVLGWPLHLTGAAGGEPSPKCRAVVAFGLELQQALARAGRPLPIWLHDESFSTVTAKERTGHFSLKRKQSAKGDLDSAAAAVFLQDFLENGEGTRLSLEQGAAQLGSTPNSGAEASTGGPL